MAMVATNSPTLSGCCALSASPARKAVAGSYVPTRLVVEKKSGPLARSSFPRISRKQNRIWKQTYSSYSGVGTDYSSPIDVAAVVRAQRIVILGGNGFVGSAIAEEAVKRDIEVVSFNRSGRPSVVAGWLDKVVWVAGNVFSADWDVVLNGATAVITTLGGFGTNEQMSKLNGDANVIAVNAAKDAGIRKFIMVSVHDYNLPDFALNIGYFTGKRRAEKEVLSLYPESGTILRPGFIYGSKRVNGVDIPLNFIGEPLEKLLAQTKVYTRPFAKLPGADVLLAPPVRVTDVALAALQAVKDDDVKGIVDIENIKELAATFLATE